MTSRRICASKPEAAAGDGGAEGGAGGSRLSGAPRSWQPSQTAAKGGDFGSYRQPQNGVKQTLLCTRYEWWVLNALLFEWRGGAVDGGGRGAVWCLSVFYYYYL